MPINNQYFGFILHEPSGVTCPEPQARVAFAKSQHSAPPPALDSGAQQLHTVGPMCPHKPPKGLRASQRAIRLAANLRTSAPRRRHCSDRQRSGSERTGPRAAREALRDRWCPRRSIGLGVGRWRVRCVGVATAGNLGATGEEHDLPGEDEVAGNPASRPR